MALRLQLWLRLAASLRRAALVENKLALRGFINSLRCHPPPQEPVWKPDAFEPAQEADKQSAEAIESKQTVEELEELEDDFADDRALEAYRWAAGRLPAAWSVPPCSASAHRLCLGCASAHHSVRTVLCLPDGFVSNAALSHLPACPQAAAHGGDEGGGGTAAIWQPAADPAERVGGAGEAGLAGLITLA